MIPSDQALYDKIKRKIWKNNPVNSAYRSGMLVQQYKKEFVKKHDGRKSPYKGKKPSKNGLSRWYKEKWKNQRGEVGYKYKSDSYRPSNRITKKTPTTHGELSKKEIKRARREKYEKGRVSQFDRD
jgi:hypothetical protein